MKMKGEYIENTGKDHSDYICEFAFVLGKEKTDTIQYINKRITEICDNLVNADGEIMFKNICEFFAKAWWEHEPTNYDIEIDDFIEEMGESLLLDFEEKYLIKTCYEKKADVEMEIVAFMKRCFYDEDCVTHEVAEKFVHEKLQKYETIIRESILKEEYQV